MLWSTTAPSCVGGKLHFWEHVQVKRPGSTFYHPVFPKHTCWNCSFRAMKMSQCVVKETEYLEDKTFVRNGVEKSKANIIQPSRHTPHRAAPPKICVPFSPHKRRRVGLQLRLRFASMSPVHSLSSIWHFLFHTALCYTEQRILLSWSNVMI